MSRILKAKLGDDLRRVTVPSNAEITLVRETLCKLFGIGPTQTLKLRYHDEEGDLITLSSTVELVEAFSTLPPNAALRVELEVMPLPAPSSSSSFPSSSSPLPSNSLSSSTTSTSSFSSSAASIFESPLPTSPPRTLEEEEEEEEEEQEEQEEETFHEGEAEREEEEEKGKEKEKEDFIPEEELPGYREEGRNPPVEKSEESSQGSSQESGGINLEFLINEFHYHRLIVQTACKAGFDSLMKEYEDHHKAKVQEMWEKAGVQSAILTGTIERTFSEWKRDVSESAPAQDFSDRVSEALKGVETFTAPVIENIRVALFNLLEKLFDGRPPASLTSSEVVREMETFRFTSSPLSNPEEQEASSSSDSPSDAPSPAEPADDDEEEVPPPPSPKTSSEIHHSPEEAFEGQVGEVQVPSSLSDEFVYVSDHEEEQPFPYQESLQAIVSMGFTEISAIKAALLACRGDVDAALNSLL